MKDDADGWWDVSARPQWTCPECKVSSPCEEWPEREPYCEDCGSHEGRECPRCGEVFDHVWGAAKIEKASKDAEKCGSSTVETSTNTTPQEQG